MITIHLINEVIEPWYNKVAASYVKWSSYVFDRLPCMSDLFEDMIDCESKYSLYEKIPMEDMHELDGYEIV